MTLARNHDFVDGTVAVADQVDDDFDTIYAAVGTQVYTGTGKIFTDDESVTASLQKLSDRFKDWTNADGSVHHLKMQALSVDPTSASGFNRLWANVAGELVSDPWKRVKLASTATSAMLSAQNVLETDGTDVYFKGSVIGGQPTVSHVRQTVMQALVDANGRAAFVGQYSGLSACLSCASTNLIATAAMGFASTGRVDRVGVHTANTQLVIPDAATSYIYAEIDGDGAVTFGYSAYAPAYQHAAPGTPSTDQHWFDLSTWKMKRYDGASWEEKYRVFLGQATAAGGSITSTISYALNGLYISAVTAWAQNNTYSILSYLGTNLFSYELWLDTDTDMASAWCVDGTNYSGGSPHEYLLTGLGINGFTFSVSANGLSSATHTSFVTSGYFRFVIKRSF